MQKTRIPQQLIPLGAVLVLLLATLFIARALLVPESFGRYGHYRADAADEIAALPSVYAGYQVCLDCHDDVQQVKAESKHAGLSCETCHGPSAAHVEDFEGVKPAVDRSSGLCTQCHEYSVSRPSGFPQIISASHSEGGECGDCHVAHNPGLLSEMEECSGCHAGVANQKKVSPHASLACTQCHTVPEAHFVTPRLAMAKRPTAVATCAACHAPGATSAVNIPRVDIAAHSGRYLCWDCHYPHFPEAQL